MPLEIYISEICAVEVQLVLRRLLEFQCEYSKSDYPIPKAHSMHT